MEQPSRSSVHSVEKALRLLDYLSEHRSPMSLNDLSQSSGYPKSTVHALLATLREHGVVTQQQDGRYLLGLRLFEWGSAVIAGWDITRSARPYLERLSVQTGASSFLSVLDGGSVISVDCCAGTAGFHVVSETGSRLPLHATSQGKLLLSALPEAEALRMVRRAGMQAFTPHTITEPERLCAELEKIRTQGCAIEDGEYKVGLRSVSAPVQNRMGQLFALGIVGLYRRVNSEEFEEAISAVTLASQQLTKAVGGK